MISSSVELYNPREDLGGRDDPVPRLSAVMDELPEGRHEFSLPPADRGKEAWLFLFASFCLEALTWGFPYAFGVFQDYYRTHAPFAGSSGIATIGTCAMGIMYFDFPIVVALQRRYPRASRYAPAAGLMIMGVALIASSFSQTVPHLIFTQGVLYALAGSVSYCPCMIWLEEWFVQRRGLAFGIMWSGTGTGGFVIPLVLQTLLEKYGFRTTLRTWGICLFVLAVPVFYLIKPRLPTRSATPIKPRDLSFVFDRTFLLYQMASIIESLGYFLPTIYLPTYARSMLGAKPFLATLTIILVNVSTAFGMTTLGFLADRLHATTCIMISTVGAVLGTFLLWGFANNLVTLYAFCLVYGFFAGAYPAPWPAITRQIISDSSTRESYATGRTFDPIMILGVMTAGRGIGNLISGPLSEALLNAAQKHVSRTWGWRIRGCYRFHRFDGDDWGC
ncbi:hypothetical protein NM208_g5370 [Fusarium decemcellulare]|uniref:Uncharacterized protein n=1 Tax=Fusarium decemcellulare TaxID=57161 RepID=A0ACC1SHA3_9HYPO|nr:hypothetical protein NM208_g5370 [Fusarium decemcellulare]